MERTSTQWVKKLITGAIPLLAMMPCRAAFVSATPAPLRIVFYEELVKGKVTDENGQPLPGVVVKVKGRNVSVMTDEQGRFSIEATPGKDVLVYSFIGLGTKEAVASASPMDIVLLPNQQQLGDVIIFAYTPHEKRTLTAAVSKVTDLDRYPANNFDQLLTGRVAGLNVINSSGLVGEKVAIRIRGAASISNSSSSNPLVVVDGMPIMTGNTSALNYNPINALSTINPADIASVDVLKDAAATAMYGSRGAAGVILVTTKRGPEGSGTISYGANAGLVKAGNELDVLSADQYNTVINQMRSNAGLTAMAAYDKNPDGSDKVVNTNWQDLLYHNGSVQQHQLSFGAGSTAYNFYGSAQYYKFDNYIRNNTLQRASARINASAQVKEWLKAGMHMSYMRNDQLGLSRDPGANVNSIPRSFFTYFPNVQVYNEDGTYYHGRGGNSAAIGGASYPNPLATLELNRQNQESRRFLGGIYLEARPLEGLLLKSQFSTDLNNVTENHFWHPKTPDGTLANFNGLNNNSINSFNSWTWYTTARYETSFDDHHLSFLGGMEYNRRKAKAMQPYAYGLKDVNFQYYGLENYTTFGGATGIFQFNDGLSSYFGNVGYDYLGKYMLTGNFRVDYHSSFMGSNRRGMFPAVSAGWRISQEDFLKYNKVISELKLRASYGITGNANVGYFPALATYQYANYADLSALGISTPGNADLKWEKSKQTDVGIDAGLWKDRLNITADWFMKKTEDLILQNPVLSTVGMPNNILLENIGQLKTTGIELALQGNIVQGERWNWTAGFNMARIKNEVTATNSKGDPIYEGFGMAKAGEELGTYYLLRFAGVDAATGRAMFLDKNGNTKMYNPANNSWTDPATGQTTTALTGTDKVAQSGKTPYPTFQGGFNSSVSYRGIDLSVGLQYAFDFYVYNQTKASLMEQTSANNKSTDILDAWSAAGQQAKYPALRWGDNQSWQESTLWLEKGNFVRVREITLGYNLPASLLSRAKIDRLRVYVQALNPFLFTSYSGMDPEANANGNTNIGLGIDNFRPFIPKTFMAGVSISL